ncbi:MAG: PIN domain-containing protein [Austwickia sp.]|nr:PIN domain-containing protein [Austwickia sp.]MCO5310856.1 PIN domain-containing protein [Austwickia sp.]
MIALDTNVLVHAFRVDSPRHRQAVAAINDAVNSGRAISVPWPCVHEFLAVVTNPRAFVTPATTTEALAAMEQLLGRDSVFTLGETPAHLATLHRLIARSGVAGPRVHDARIAAICLDHSVDELWTADRDFGSFPDLRTRNPLVTPR